MPGLLIHNLWAVMQFVAQDKEWLRLCHTLGSKGPSQPVVLTLKLISLGPFYTVSENYLLLQYSELPSLSLSLVQNILKAHYCLFKERKGHTQALICYQILSLTHWASNYLYRL